MIFSSSARIRSLHTLMILFLLFMATGCSEVDSPDTSYDAMKIDQHMDAEVTFDETYRPQYHYTPKINWMNDPNGLVYFDGAFHLFHQYNPFGKRWGFMSWNHAVSEDLVHWEHRPVAIPYGNEEQEGIFSGSAVVDHENTSGLGNGDEPPIVAIYTSAYEGETPSQAQSLAYSIDGGRTFTKYPENPVLTFDDPDFRDPNVKWNEEMGQWLMIVALPQQRKVQFYASDNLINWVYLSDFGPAGAVDGIWECPDLFPIAVDGDPDNVKWVLHVDMNPGSVAGGSGSQYFIGDWNGTEFTVDESAMGDEILWADFGPDYYAAISWNNIPEEDGRRIWLGWMNNWLYANDIPTDPWRSAMSIPRTVELVSSGDSLKVVQKPVQELQQLRGETVAMQSLEVDGNRSLTDEGISGRAYEMVVEINPMDAEKGGLKLRASDGEETILGYDAETGTVYLDRTNSGEDAFHENFEKRFDAPANLRDGKVKLHIFVDWSSVEVFINDGDGVITSRIFPVPESTGVSLFSEGGQAAIENLEFWPMGSIWEDV